MASFNQVTLLGNLCADPVLRYTPAGSAVCEVGVAVNYKYRTASGEAREDVSFFYVVCWCKTAEILCQYAIKGLPVLFGGRLTQERWQDKTSGQNRSRVRVNAETVQLLGSRQSEQQSSQ